jgi:glycine dehydrogenase
MKINLQYQEKFELRHHGKNADELAEMLRLTNVASVDELIDQTVPKAIRLPKPLDLPLPKSEADFLSDFKNLARQNVILSSYIGTGYYDTITPTVILRNILVHGLHALSS